MVEQLLDAVVYMHASGVVHSDIKAENVFLTAQGDVKLGDFGFSSLVAPGQRLSSFCGSLLYAAPELVSTGSISYDGFKVCRWVGCTC